MSGDDDDDDSPPLPSGARETRTAISCDVTELRAPGGPLDVTLPSASGGRFELIGRVLDGRYRLDRLLGVGGMGQVYAGLHLSLDVPIAVKVMHPSIAAIEENVVRFRREARAMSHLTHPNTVAVWRPPCGIAHDHQFGSVTCIAQNERPHSAASQRASSQRMPANSAAAATR